MNLNRNRLYMIASTVYSWFNSTYSFCCKDFNLITRLVSTDLLTVFKKSLLWYITKSQLIYKFHHGVKSYFPINILAYVLKFGKCMKIKFTLSIFGQFWTCPFFLKEILLKTLIRKVILTKVFNTTHFYLTSDPHIKLIIQQGL